MRSTFARRSPINHIKDDQLFMILRTYFDGSGKADDPQHRFITLACCAASESSWEGFEQKWKAALGMATFMHMKEAMASPPRGHFSTWEWDEIEGLVERLVSVIRGANQLGLVSYMFSVDLRAYQKWTHRLLLEKRPEYECASWCFYRAAECYRDGLAAAGGPVIKGGIDAYFDKGEQYMNSIYRHWSRKDYKRRYPILDLVRSVQPVDMRETPGVQLADMLAWSRNRLLSQPSEGLKARISEAILGSISRKAVFVNEDQFQSVHARDSRDLILIPPESMPS